MISPLGQRGDGRLAVLVTVHGTWATGAAWAKADSELARAVVEWFAERGANASVVPFQWSGRNSVAARRTAGASLAEHLGRIQRDNPSVSLYVIAHSHGGSVFAYATKFKPEIVDKIDGFIALATPWVGMEVCNYAIALRGILAKLTLYSIFATILVVLPFIFIL